MISIHVAGSNSIMSVECGGVVGKGTFSHVVAAKRVGSTGPYDLAVKRAIVPEHNVTLRREVFYLRRYAHDNIIKLLTYGMHDRLRVLVMPLYADSVANLPLDARKLYAKQIAIAMMRGLAYLHGNKVVHCDIKPANLLVKTPVITDPSLVALGDFGLAIMEGELETIMGSRGTMNYIAPEFLIKPRTTPVTNRADIWSAGGTLYYVYMDHAPFEQDTPEKTKTLISTHTQRPVITCEPWADSICQRMLAKHPMDRSSAACILSIIDDVPSM